MKTIKNLIIKNLKSILKKNLEIFGLISLIIVTVLSISFFNYKKNLQNNAYNNFIDNVYLKKTLNHLVINLNPKYKKIKHKIKSGENFEQIL